MQLASVRPLSSHEGGFLPPLATTAQPVEAVRIDRHDLVAPLANSVLDLDAPRVRGDLLLNLERLRLTEVAVVPRPNTRGSCDLRLPPRVRTLAPPRARATILRARAVNAMVTTDTDCDLLGPS